MPCAAVCVMIGKQVPHIQSQTEDGRFRRHTACRAVCRVRCCDRAAKLQAGAERGTIRKHTGRNAEQSEMIPGGEPGTEKGKDKGADMTDRKRAAAAFREYVKPYDITNDKIRLKVEHTGRVAAGSERIARSLGLSAEDCDLAWLIGLLHDIGRFEQLRIYNTFNDAASIDHGRFGADLLFGSEGERLIRRFMPAEDPEAEHLIELAIRHHSDYLLPEGLNERELLFARLIRDADKVDIFRVNTEFSLESIYNTDTETLRSAEITPVVKRTSLSHQTILRSIRKTPVDIIVGHISLPYGIEYPESLRMIREQGYLEKLMGFQSENEKTARDLDEITAEVRRWMEEKTA